MIGRLNHIAIVVPDLDAATALYRDTLGAQVSEPLRLDDHGVTTVFVDLANTRIELLHPLGTVLLALWRVLSPDSNRQKTNGSLLPRVILLFLPRIMWRE